jgi:hypothetical protein
MSDQVVQAPKSSAHIAVEQLAYVESFDAVVDKDYALVAYKETKTDSGKWVLRIKSATTAGAVIDPDNASLKQAFKKAAAHAEEFVVWGFNLTPKGEDPRLVENRIFVGEDRKPTHVEIHLVTRKADGSPMPEQVARFDWPS